MACLDVMLALSQGKGTMPNDSVEDLTQLIRKAGQGHADAKEQVVGLVYDDIKRHAERLMQSERNVTLQPTALANEVFLRLLESESMANASDRAYFFAAAAKAMRRILVDEARRRNAKKRGGEFQQLPLDDVFARYERQNLDLLGLDEALSELENVSPRQARIVHLRWFMELSVKEVSDLLEISVSTVEADWRAARAYLKLRLNADR